MAVAMGALQADVEPVAAWALAQKRAGVPAEADRAQEAGVERIAPDLVGGEGVEIGDEPVSEPGRD
jgi:hypothetical protein